MPLTKHLFPAALLAVFTFLAPESVTAGLPPGDFTLGPGGQVTIAVDEDSTSAGCLNTDSSECDSYSMKIPFKIDSSGDLSTDLSGAGSVNLVIFATTGQLCSHSIFEASIPATSVKLSKTKTSESAKFSGLTTGEGVKGQVMVPTSLKIKAGRKTGIGTLTVKGLGQGLGALSGATVEVAFSIHDSADDSDIDSSCATVPVSFKKSP